VTELPTVEELVALEGPRVSLPVSVELSEVLLQLVLVRVVVELLEVLIKLELVAVVELSVVELVCTSVDVDNDGTHSLQPLL